MITGNGIRNKQFREPVYRDGAGNVYGDFWAPDKFGSRYVGGRTVTPTAQVSNLRVPDAPGNAPGKPRPAFE